MSGRQKPAEKKEREPHQVTSMAGLFLYRASCRTCGWQGRKHWRRQDADDDASRHAEEAG